jgi:alcohol dehydrogenase YqhD (iron-dependent ADH family)
MNFNFYHFQIRNFEENFTNMLNFEFKNPTKIIFGKGEIAKISREIPKTEKILVLYGGGSIKSNGVYDQVKSALEGYEWEEFGGIPANPEYEVLIEALKVIKEKNITYMLAVGGGSVIDGVNFFRLLLNSMANLGTFYKKESEPKKEKDFLSLLYLHCQQQVLK